MTASNTCCRGREAAYRARVLGWIAAISALGERIARDGAVLSVGGLKSSADSHGEGEIMPAETLILLGMFAGGALAGLLSRWGPLSGWAALAFPLVLPPVAIGLTILFC